MEDQLIIEVAVGVAVFIITAGLSGVGFWLARFIRRFGAVPAALEKLLKVNDAQSETIGVILDAIEHHSAGLSDLAEALKEVGCNGKTDSAMKHAASARANVNVHRDKRVREAMEVNA